MRKFILIVALLTLFGCSQNSSSPTEITEPIEDALGITPYLPKTDYPVGFVTIEYSQVNTNGEMTKGDPSKANIHYLMSTDKLLDEDLKEAWEDQNSLEDIVYGDLYMDPIAITVTISPSGAGDLKEAEQIEIEDQQVQYASISLEPKTVFIYMDVDEIGYEIQYSTDADDIEKDAKEFAKDIIKNN